METAEITALTVVFFIAAVEVCCFFVISKLRGRSYPLCVVMPVFAEDSELPQRLDYIGSLVEEGSVLAENILLIDYGGTAEQIELCRDFCTSHHAAEMILPEEIEKSMKKYLHFIV
ncbi:hypothetical protein [Ruminococcus flavefaciens]|uniref:hypothetical protein n=1 Tax=Ruminococcus flavefaciens TaxID=1265 RepID=UPI0004912B41|nr:hypothetical protein [Ruminococcus flavefaciens]